VGRAERLNQEAVNVLLFSEALWGLAHVCGVPPTVGSGVAPCGDSCPIPARVIHLLHSGGRRSLIFQDGLEASRGKRHVAQTPGLMKLGVGMGGGVHR
jgi:hypothetical protein